MIFDRKRVFTRWKISPHVPNEPARHLLHEGLLEPKWAGAFQVSWSFTPKSSNELVMFDGEPIVLRDASCLEITRHSWDMFNMLERWMIANTLRSWLAFQALFFYLFWLLALPHIAKTLGLPNEIGWSNPAKFTPFLVWRDMIGHGLCLSYPPTPMPMCMRRAAVWRLTFWELHLEKATA